MRHQSEVLERQKPLITTYLMEPEKAWVTDVAIVKGQNLNDPFHTEVIANDELETPIQIGVHRAVGGLHDAPNPGDMLCTALAACFESTLRLVANRLGITLVETEVKATAEVDVRGTLMVDKSVPVAFQKMTLTVNVSCEQTAEQLLHTMLAATEKSCIVLQTLKMALPVRVKTNFAVLAA
ncbi:OsmC family protein [Roseivirga sp. E12]|uniref:OsmC family protein n=1 Tax=Roseivirga sp. E12 TaxID=2819237 RepID=UPI001ABC6912|nr:OsmC family protein [Roseivirga sp. E12]MBO3700265.1 OsmC family protein [Roseivirga sp. E12]